MKSTKLIKKNTQGQISIEMLILWTILAGILAAFIPPFTNAMEAHQTLAHYHTFETFSRELEEAIERMEYAGPGSQLTLNVPPLEEMKITVSANEITLTFYHESLSQSKERVIRSKLPLNGNISIENEHIRIVREEDAITIQLGYTIPLPFQTKRGAKKNRKMHWDA